MGIDLGRLEKIGNQDKPFIAQGMPFGYTEVLTMNKIPFQGTSFLREYFYQCPFFKKSAIKQIIEWRCTSCHSKVIYWKCYLTEEEDKHGYYDLFIKEFYDETERKMNGLEKNKGDAGDEE